MTQHTEAPARVDEVRLQLVGSPRLFIADGQGRPLERTEAALLGLLAIDGEQPRLQVARLFWPDLDTAQALNNLRQRLFRMKRMRFAPLVDIGPHTLRLQAGVTHDLDRLAERLREDSAAATGDLLAGIDHADNGGFSDWLTDARARWHQQRQAALQALADELEAADRLDEALPYARRLLAGDRLAEQAHRRLMRLHYRLGDRSRALAAYHACSQVLADELGGRRPAAQTQALAELIERSDALGPAAAGPPGTALPKGEPASSGPRAPVPPRASRLPPALLRPPTLVARATAWGRMAQAWDRRQVVVLRGEPGVGKSRLAGDFARARGDVAIGIARPGDKALPFAVLTRLLRQWVDRHGPPRQPWVREELAHWLPELGPAASAQTEALRQRQALLHALRDWMADGLSALVVDDMQFADHASIECLLEVAAATRDGAEASDPAQTFDVLFTVRSAEMPEALAAWLSTQPADALLELELEPLGYADLVTLLDSLAVPGLDARVWGAPLWRHTGGNPLFVLETVIDLLLSDRLPAGAGTGTGQLPSPQSVGKLIERRLLALPAGALRLAQIAAIAGLDFDVELAASVLGRHALDLAADWSTLEAAQVLRDAAFAHDLIAEAALRTVPASISRVIHREVARVLEGRATEGGSAAARIAEHWWAAEEWSAAARQFRLAAKTVAAQARRDEELRLLDRAATAHDRAGEAAPAFDARVKAIDALITVGSLAEAGQRLTALEANADDDRHRLALSLLAAKIAMTNYRPQDADGPARLAIDLAERLGDVAGVFDGRNLLASSLGLQGRTREALALLALQPSPLPASAGSRSRCDFHGTYGYVLSMAHQRHAAVKHYGEAAQLAEEAGEYDEALTFLNNLAGLQQQLGHPEQALATLLQAQRMRQRLGQLDGVPAVAHDYMLGLVCSALGRFGQALTAFDSASRLASQAGSATWQATVQGQLANLYLTLGQPARAARLLQPLPEGLRAGQRVSRAIVEARLAVATGRDPTAILSAALTLMADQPRAVERLGAELALASARGDLDGLALCRSARASAAAAELEALVISARVREVRLLSGLGDTEAAATLATELWSTLCDHPRWPGDLYRVELWRVLAEALDAQGLAHEAAAVLTAARQWMDAAAAELPASLRHGFLYGNPANRALLERLSRRR